MKSRLDQSRTIEELSARCDGPNQFDSFDRAFRKSLTVSKAALLKRGGASEAAPVEEAAKKPS